MERDVVVVGSGGAGLTAAITAAKSGLDVLVIEKTGHFGGATAMSGGGTWVPANSLARKAGLPDTVEEARRYVQHVTPNVRRNLLDAFLEASPAMLDFLMEETEVDFAVAPFSPDYNPDLEGASQDGRMLSPVAYDGRRLGAYFDLLRTPLAEFNAPMGMMIDLSDMQHVLAPFGSAKSFVHVAKMVGRLGRDRIRHRRGTRLTMGNALAGRLLRSALDAGVELRRNTHMTRLVREDNRIVAVEIDQGGIVTRVDVRRGVVLAAGGFSANPAMRRKHIPFAEHHISLMPPGNTGDGISAAEAVGATMDLGNAHNAAWTVISRYPRRDGSIGKWPHLFLDRPKPGYIIVGKDGRRVGDEAALDFVAAMHRAGAVPAHLICDARALRRYGLGAVLPHGIRLHRLIRAGYIVAAPTLRALAGKIGVDPDGLEQTAARMNAYAASGHDPEFGKGSNAFDRSIGDHRHTPNPCLGPIRTAPFYAVLVNPGDATTTFGLHVDERARVLDEDGHSISGLYACGLDMNSIWRGSPPGNGANNTLSLTFGYIAGRDLARSNMPPGGVPATHGEG